MKKSLLFSLLFTVLTASAQTTETYFIDWSFNSNSNSTGSTNADRTVEVGDTVTWNWYAEGFHNVVSNDDATESFASELIGPGSTFSHTFTEVGTNGYVCTPHSGNMFGVITVVPDGSLNTQEFAGLDGLSLYPNPARDVVFLKMNANNASTLNISVYNPLGQKIKEFREEASDNLRLDLSELNPGLYFMRIIEGENSVTKRLIVQ
jgi:plastocyanin